MEIFGCNYACFFDDRTLPAMVKKAGFAIRRKDSFQQPVNLAAVTAVEQLGRPFGITARKIRSRSNGILKHGEIPVALTMHGQNVIRKLSVPKWHRQASGVIETKQLVIGAIKQC